MEIKKTVKKTNILESLSRAEYLRRYENKTYITNQEQFSFDDLTEKGYAICETFSENGWDTVLHKNIFWISVEDFERFYKTAKDAF